MLRVARAFIAHFPSPELKEGNVAVHTAPPSQMPVDYDGYAVDDERGYGWVTFAGVMLLILGTLNFIEGLAAIGNAHFFTANAHYIAGSLNTWGWVVLCIGVLEWLSAVACSSRSTGSPQSAPSPADTGHPTSSSPSSRVGRAHCCARPP